MCTSESNLLSDHSSDSAWSDSEFDDDVYENTGANENTVTHVNMGTHFEVAETALQVPVPGVSTISITTPDETGENKVFIKRIFM